MSDNVLDEVVQTGVEWVTNSKQPKGSITTQFGRSGKLGLGMSVGFAPTPPYGMGDKKGQVSIVILDAGYEFLDDGTSEARRLTEDDVTIFEAALARAGATVVRSWNGAGGNSGSWCIEGCSSTLAKSYQTYHDGCPEHKTVFCGRKSWSSGNEEDDCPWFHTGSAVLVPPAFPQVPDYERPAPAPSIGDRNLEAVLAALAVLQPIAEDVGIVPSTLTVGRRGRVEDDEYVDEEGLGVTLPAEAALRIAELLKAAIDLGAI
jgi:hypothetical protein